MFDIYESLQSQSSGLSDGLSAHAVGGWQPDISNGSSAGWGRTDNNRDSHSGPELVWNKDGVSDPLGLVDMDDEEREVRGDENLHRGVVLGANKIGSSSRRP